MKNGSVKWFNNKKGFGFITGDDGEEVFVHYSSINMEGFKTIKEGARVTYEIFESEKGAQARNVSVIE